MDNNDSAHPELLRMDDQAFRQIVAVLTRAQPIGSGPADRASPRADYTMHGRVTAEFEHGGGGEPTLFRVRPIDISATGVRVLHGVTVRPGSRCAIHTSDLRGMPVELRGVIVRSKLIGPRVFEIAVRFDSPIDITRFVRADADAA